MPISPDPAARARQIAALKKGDNPAPGGNQRARRTGAYANVGNEPFAQLWVQRFFDQLSEDSPLREDERFRHYLAVASNIFARLESVKAWLDVRMTDLDSPAVGRALDVETKLRREVTDVLERLKLAPLSPSDDLAFLQMVDDLDKQFGVVRAELATAMADRDAAIAEAESLRAQLEQATVAEEVTDAEEVPEG